MRFCSPFTALRYSNFGVILWVHGELIYRFGFSWLHTMYSARLKSEKAVSFMLLLPLLFSALSLLKPVILVLSWVVILIISTLVRFMLILIQEYMEQRHYQNRKRLRFFLYLHESIIYKEQSHAYKIE